MPHRPALAEHSPWTIERLTPRLGARLDGLQLHELDNSQLSDLEQLLVQHKVLFFPQQLSLLPQQLSLSWPA